MSESDGTLWIVFADFRGPEPRSAHWTKEAAEEEARKNIALSMGATYSVWSAKLTHPMTPAIAGMKIVERSDFVPDQVEIVDPSKGIPIRASRDATNDVLDLAIKPDAGGVFDGD